VAAAGGVADVADGGPPGKFAHDAFELRLMVEAEGLDDRADLLEGVEDLVAAGIVGGEASRQLTAVLQVEQDPWHQGRAVVRPLSGREFRRLRTIEMVDRGDATLVL